MEKQARLGFILPGGERGESASSVPSALRERMLYEADDLILLIARDLFRLIRTN
jgi:hypothetical protein